MSVNYDPDDGGMSLKAERAAVTKGATLLDKILPGWHKKVKLSELEMSSGFHCMMGQLFGHEAEASLAKKMYPKEMQEAEDEHGIAGYSKAMFRSGENETGPTLIHKLMKKLGLASSADRARLRALQHVCSGHDNKCLWAEQIAERRVRDKEKPNERRKG